MAAIQYSPTARCGCGAPLKVFVSSGRAAKCCDKPECKRRAYNPPPKTGRKRGATPRCTSCGVRIWSGGKLCKACYEQCRSKAERDHVCKGCGVAFVRRKRNNDACEYCSRRCAYAHIGQWRAPVTRIREHAPFCKVWFRVCEECSRPFVSRQPHKRACSKACAEQRAWRLSQVEYGVRACKVCGGHFVPDRTGGKRPDFCSDRCKLQVHRKQQKVSKLRRKARVRGVTAESVDPIRVFERDRWTCKLCGVKTPKARRGTLAANAPEMDHIVPISKGGAHAYLNVQCACRACNQAKSDRTLGQLLLVG